MGFGIRLCNQTDEYSYHATLISNHQFYGKCSWMVLKRARRVPYFSAVVVGVVRSKAGISISMNRYYCNALLASHALVTHW